MRVPYAFHFIAIFVKHWALCAAMLGVFFLAGCADTPEYESASAGRTYQDAEATGQPGVVFSPYDPHYKIDVHGMQVGDLVQDPSNKRLFRIPTDAFARTEVAEEEEPDFQRASDDTISTDQQRVLGNLAAIVATTALANELDQYDNILATGTAVFLRLTRINYISDLLKQGFPEWTPFENRMATRVAGLLIDNRLTFENLSEQTIRGEIVNAFKEQGGEVAQDAKVVNFLYMLCKARNQN